MVPKKMEKQKTLDFTVKWPKHGKVTFEGVNSKWKQELNYYL